MEWRVNVRSDADKRLHGLWIFSSVATNATATGMYTISHFHRSQSRLWPSAFAVHSREVDKECSFIFLNCYFIAYNNSITCGGNVRQPLAHNKSSRTHTPTILICILCCHIILWPFANVNNRDLFFPTSHLCAVTVARSPLCRARSTTSFRLFDHHRIYSCNIVVIYI